MLNMLSMLPAWFEFILNLSAFPATIPASSCINFLNSFLINCLSVNPFFAIEFAGFAFQLD